LSRVEREKRMRRSSRKGKGDECKVKRDVKGVGEVENVQTQVRNQVEPRKERKSPLWIDPTTSRKDGSQLGRSGEAIRGGGRARNPRKTSTAKQNEGRRRNKQFGEISQARREGSFRQLFRGGREG